MISSGLSFNLFDMPTHSPERGRDIPLDRANLERTADRMMLGMMDLFHPRANRVLAPHLSQDFRTGRQPELPFESEGKAVFDKVRNWLIARLEQLELGALDNGQLILNPWNDIAKVGLQSVSVKVNRLVEGPQRVPALLPGEWKDPTIGIIARGMLKGRFPDVTGSLRPFGVDPGKAEELTAMSNGFLVGVNNRISSLNAGEQKTVVGPDAVQVYVENEIPANPDPRVDGYSVAEAVYACVFKTVDGHATR